MKSKKAPWQVFKACHGTGPISVIIYCKSDNHEGLQQRCEVYEMWDGGDVGRPRSLPSAMSADRDVVQGRKRAVGVANRPREISSDQARRQKAIFLRKM